MSSASSSPIFTFFSATMCLKSSITRSRLIGHLPLQVVVLEVLERKLDILDQRCRDLSHIQEGFVGRLERPEPLQYFISHLKYRTRFARHSETSWASPTQWAPA